MTEFAFPAGKVYLSPYFDGYIVSLSIITSPNAELANTMLDEAIARLSKDENPIVSIPTETDITVDRDGESKWD